MTCGEPRASERHFFFVFRPGEGTGERSRRTGLVTTGLARYLHPVRIARLCFGMILTLGSLGLAATQTACSSSRPGTLALDGGMAPSGWLGPVVLWSGAGTPPACEGAWATSALDAYADLSAPAATCTCGDCGPSTGESCAPIEATFWTNATCSGAPCGSASLTTCTDVMNGSCSDSVSYTTATSPPTGGSCAPQTTVNPLTSSWGLNARLCAYSDAQAVGNCGPDTNLVCPSASYGAHVCIYTEGPSSCPSPYDSPSTFYQSIAESRSCVCTCSAPSGGSCSGGGGTLFAAAACGTDEGLHAVTSNDACEYANLGNVLSTVGSAPSLTPGTCSQSGVQTTGNATPAQSITVCCTP